MLTTSPIQKISSKFTHHLNACLDFNREYYNPEPKLIIQHQMPKHLKEVEEILKSS